MNKTLSYKEVTDLIEKQYSWLKRKYPLSYYYLETEIRLFLNGENPSLEKYLKIYSKIPISRIVLLAVYKRLLFFVAFLSGQLSKRIIYLNIARHPQLQKRLNTELKQSGLEVLEHPPKYLKMLRINKYVPLGPIVNHTFKLRNLRRLIKRIGLLDFLASDKNLDKLENVLEERVKNVAALLFHLKIKYLILQNEHCPHEKILILAAERVEAKTIIMAHGYFQKSSSLITVAPIRANELIVWTASQVEMLLKETDASDHQKISYYGWPYETIQWNSNRSDMSPLFILGDIDNDFDENKFKLTVEVLTKFVAAYPRVRIRPHPTFWLSSTHRKKLIETKFNQHIKNETLIEQLRHSNLVTGHDSSVLVQAYYEKIPTYRIKEISQLAIPEVPVISLEEILSMAVHEPKLAVEFGTEITDGVEKVTRSIVDKIISF